MNFKSARNLDIFVIILSMALLSLHFSAGILGTLFPIMKMKYSRFKMLTPIIILLIFKIIVSIFLDPGQYSTYELNFIFIIRESLAIILFYTWFIIGMNIYQWSFFASLNWKSMTVALFSLPLVQVFSVGAPIMAGADASQVLFFFLIFVIFYERTWNIYLKFLALTILLSTSFALRSSFTTICGLTLLFVLLINSTFISRFMVPWRITVIVAIVLLSFASTFASKVNLKEATNNSGNNGATREVFAGYAFSIFSDFPIFGTPMGRGIVPSEAIEQMGWKQYFDPDVAQEITATYGFQSFDIYALSFHNSFLYLLTRFGIFSVLLFYLIIREVPRRAPLSLVLFSMVMLLSISADVVIESVRAGPGVALVLGSLFSFQRKPIARLRKTAVPRTISKFGAPLHPGQLSRLSGLAWEESQG